LNGRADFELRMDRWIAQSWDIYEEDFHVIQFQRRLARRRRFFEWPRWLKSKGIGSKWWSINSRALYIVHSEGDPHLAAVNSQPCEVPIYTYRASEVFLEKRKKKSKWQ
jgi:hypothetical protein